AAYDRLGEASPADVAVISYKKARVLLAARRFEDAREAAQVAAGEAPRHAMVQAVLGLVDMHLERLDQSIARLQRVIDRHRDLDGVRPMLACALAQHGR